MKPGRLSGRGDRVPLKRDFKISSPFGMRVHPIAKVEQLHEGIDIICDHEKIYSYGPGFVLRAAFHENLGYFIDVQHKGYLTRYQHLSKMYVEPGQKIETGELIGVSGNTGLSTGPHLHFGIQVKGKWVDPLLFSEFEEIKITVDGIARPGLKDRQGKTYVAVRETFEALGVGVSWSAKDGVEVEAKAIKDYEKIKIATEILNSAL